jgi:hypothetical protein
MRRWINTGFGLGMMLLIGFLREKYVLNILNRELPFLIPRSATALNLSDKVESVFANLFLDPRWTSTFFLFLAMEAFTAYTLYAYFRKKYVVVTSLLMSGILGALAALCVLGGILLNSTEAGYKSAINIMYLLQLPFILLVLFPVFYYIENSKKDSPAISSSPHTIK